MELSLSFFIGVIGNIVAALLFLVPVKTFKQIVKHKSTQGFDSLPYIITLLNASVWTYYGLTKAGETLVATLNAFGVVIEIVYVILFLIYAPPRIRVKNIILVGVLNVGFVAILLWITEFVIHGELRTYVLGFVCDGISILMYASPLAVMKSVVTTKSVEYMPFLLSLFVLLTGGIWTIYAVFLQDIFLLVPNIVGICLGVAQLVLYAIYRKSKRITILVVEDDVEQQESLLVSSSP